MFARSSLSRPKTVKATRHLFISLVRYRSRINSRSLRRRRNAFILSRTNELPFELPLNFHSAIKSARYSGAGETDRKYGRSRARIGGIHFHKSKKKKKTWKYPFARVHVVRKIRTLRVGSVYPVFTACDVYARHYYYVRKNAVLSKEQSRLKRYPIKCVRGNS